MSPDWDTYYCKHCARLYGWLPASKDYREQAKKATIKYFTLSDTKAIDIFMFEMEGLLARDKSGTLPNVVICEGDWKKVPEILKVVRPPIKEAIITGRLQDVLTFEDDEYTKATPVDAYEKDPKKRARLRLKRNFERLRLYFPFDIINFDPCDSLLNPDIANNRLYQALESVFELQKSTGRFLLFITTPLFNVAPKSISQLREDYEGNVSKYSKITEALLSSVKATDYGKIDENKRFAMGVAKSVTLRAARNKGWDCEHKGIYIYENEIGHKILSSVVSCTQMSGEPSETSYVVDIIRIISGMPNYYSYSASSSNQKVKENLGKIVQFREESRTK